MPSPKYKTSGYPLKEERAGQYVADSDDIKVVKKTKKPVKGEKEA